MTMLFSINEGDTPLTRLFGGDPLSDANFLGVLMDQEMTPPSPISSPVIGIRIPPRCSMTGIRRDISARTPEQIQKTGVPSARQAICFLCFLPIIRELLWNSKAQPDMILRSFRSGTIRIKNCQTYNGIIYSIAQNSEKSGKDHGNSGLHLWKP